ncbi:MAG: serine protease [Deferribacterales bacterium]
MLRHIRKLLLILTITAAFSTTHAEDSITARIIGGLEVSTGSLPFVVALLNTTGSTEYDQQFCGGTLITNTWVMTAAHCVDDLSAPYSNLKIMAGSVDLSTTAAGVHETLSVTDVHIHPLYNPSTYNNDIALIELSSPVITGSPVDYVSTAAFPYYTTGLYALVAGWGSTSYPAPYNYPSTMRDVSVPMVDDTICDSVYPNYTTKMVCAGYADGGRDSCFGDSGGPLLSTDGTDFAVIGVVSFGEGCAVSGYYGVYTKVSQFTAWIEGYTGALATNPTFTPVNTAVFGPLYVPPTTPVTTGGGGGGGGCSASKDGSPIGFILMLSAAGIYFIRRRFQ